APAGAGARGPSPLRLSGGAPRVSGGDDSAAHGPRRPLGGRRVRQHPVPVHAGALPRAGVPRRRDAARPRRLGHVPGAGGTLHPRRRRRRRRRLARLHPPTGGAAAAPGRLRAARGRPGGWTASTAGWWPPPAAGAPGCRGSSSTRKSSTGPSPASGGSSTVWARRCGCSRPDTSATTAPASPPACSWSPSGWSCGGCREPGGSMLTWLILLPVLGAAVVLAVPRRRSEVVLPLGVALSVLPLALAGYLFVAFEPVAGYQFVERAVWWEPWGISWHLGIDGISMPLVVLTTILVPISLAASAPITQRRKEFVVYTLVLEAATLGVFMSL